MVTSATMAAWLQTTATFASLHLVAGWRFLHGHFGFEQAMPPRCGLALLHGYLGFEQAMPPRCGLALLHGYLGFEQAMPILLRAGAFRMAILPLNKPCHLDFASLHLVEG